MGCSETADSGPAGPADGSSCRAGSRHRNDYADSAVTQITASRALRRARLRMFPHRPDEMQGSLLDMLA